MIRRKIWATATCCLAVAGAAKAQTGAAPKAILGVPKSDPAGYIARGVAPNPGYPKYIPRNYVAPTAPTYATPPANLVPATPGMVAAPTELFAVDADPGLVQTTPPTGAPMPPPAPMAAGPMPTPVVGPAPTVVDPGMPMPGAIPQGVIVTSPMPGAPMYNGPMLNGGPIGEAPFLDGACGFGDGPMPCIWVSGEFINWRMKSVTVPPLMTTAPAGSPGTLDDANTTIVYGNKNLMDEWNSGYRIRGGFWFPDGKAGIDLGFFSIGPVSEQFQSQALGGNGLFRPFFNTAINAEDAHIVTFTDPVAGPLVAGTITSSYETLLWGAEVNYRIGWGMGLGGRLDALIGYRYLQLHDKMSVSHQFTTLAPLGGAPAGALITSTDDFDAKNQFNGGQVGFAGEWQIGLMSFGLRGTVALGYVSQDVEIRGQTVSTIPGVGSAVVIPAGLLAQSTNIGENSRQRFAIVPEIGATLGYQVTNNIRLFGGYNLLCWTNTVRSGEQINRNINATYIADPTTGVSAPSGAPAPTFHHRDETFYVQGYSLGIEFRW